EIIGPWMKSILNVATLAGVVYAAADENRRARLEGRQVKSKKPKTPLEEVMSEVGLEVPDLEGLMTNLLGGGPEANQRAAEIINSRDQAQLFREYLIRFATGQPPPSDPASTATPQPAAPATPPLASEASAPAPGPANSPPHVAQPRAHVHAGVPHGFGPPHGFVPPQGYGMPPHGFVTPHGF